jgi:hypothetical protein
MVSTSSRITSLPLTGRVAEILISMADDMEDAPWMSMNSAQFWAIVAFVTSVQDHRRAHGLPGYVASMLPIICPAEDRDGKTIRRQLSPDAFLAWAEDHRRASYDLEVERIFPAFVLEVVSPSSVQQDEVDKVLAYDALGAEEYALFTPGEGGPSTLKGYRRDAAGRFTSWQPDAAGRLWSTVLELWLVVRGEFLRAETREGMLLLTWAEQREARQRAEQIAQEEAEARQRAEQMAQEEHARAARLEAELARLRARLQDQDDPTSL